MIRINTIPLICLFIMASTHTYAQDFNHYFTTGISNHGNNKEKPYVTAGNRSYIIGNQNGHFPDMGNHVKGEMGGLWIHPIKIMDGFWLNISDSASGQGTWLADAAEFINYPHGNELRYPDRLDGVSISRFQFCPDDREGIVVEYRFSNRTAQAKTLDLQFAAKTDLSPVWFSNEIGIFDFPDIAQWDENNKVFTAKDSVHAWHAVWGTSLPALSTRLGESVALPEETSGGGVPASSSHTLSINPHATTSIRFVFAGSTQSLEEARVTYQCLQDNHDSLLQQKKAHYRSLLETAKVTIPDTALQQVYDWVKINTEWLVRTVPGIGTGLTAGYMEYPWWFGCDNSYALQAVLATGNAELAKNTLRLLLKKSEEVNGNGRIVHEISTNGAVSNKGNTQETAHFIMCVARVYEYTGDEDFVREMYPYILQGINWLLTDMDQNKNRFPEGYGIMEVYGLNAELIDVSVYTQQALEAGAMLASVMGETTNQTTYAQLALQLKDKINEHFWDEASGSYCDFYGTTSQAIAVCEGALEQLRRDNRTDSLGLKAKAYYENLKETLSTMPEQSRGWLTNKNWVINTPMETGIAPRDKALTALNIIREQNTGPHGPYLAAAVDRRNMMTIATGVQAVAESRYGRIDEALWYVQRIVETFGRALPGSISEMMPDFGCFTQAWTNYGVVLPLTQYIFGIQPDAYNKRIVIAPQFPADWQHAAIENVPIGDDLLTFKREASDGEVRYLFSLQKGTWPIEFKPLPETGKRYYLNGQLIDGETTTIRMNERNNELIVKD